MEVLTKQPPTGSSYHHFITTNSFFRELKKYYNHALPQFIKKEKKTKHKMVLKDSLKLTSFHSFFTILLYTQLHPNNFLAHSCPLGPCICSPSARNPFPQHLVIHIYLRFYLNSSGSIIQL